MKRVVSKELVVFVFIVAFSLTLFCIFTKTGFKKRIQNVDELKQNVNLVAKNTEKELASSYGEFFRGISDNLNGFLHSPGQ